MARRTYFSFHYNPDNWRVQSVRKSWLTKPDRESSGFFDAADWEEAKKESERALKVFIGKQLNGTSVTCVCVGTETAYRRWVRYEIQRSFVEGRGLLATRVHKLKNSKAETSSRGPNPFEALHVELLDEGARGQLWEYDYSAQKWAKSLDYPDPFSMKGLPWRLSKSAQLSDLFKIYDYVDDDGYNKLGDWIEAAAKQAGR